MGESRVSGLWTILAGLACVAISILADVLFLPHQSLWNDEATQLSGITLSPVEVTKWLAGKTTHDFGVPDDRMPPVSYWAGWGWSKLFGLSETALRFLSVTCVAIATGVVFGAARRAWGLGPAIAAGLLLATSPNVVIQGVEIRAYPLLILETSVIFACLLGHVEAPPGARGKWLLGILVAGVLAMYTHFFGLVALGGALVAVFATTIVRREKVTPVLVAGFVAGVLAVGLAPFVLASVSLTKVGKPVHDDKLMPLVRLGYRLFAHPAMSLSAVAVAVSALGFVLAIGCGLTRKRQSGWSAMAVALALASGASVVVLVHLAQHSFEATRTSYNAWMYPPLFLVMASGLAATRWAVPGSGPLVGLGLVLGANMFAVSELAVRGDDFAHTAYGPIARMVRQAGPGQVALIYEGDLTHTYFIYSPSRYDFAGKLDEFAVVPENSNADDARVAAYPRRKPETLVDPSGLPFSELIVIQTREWRAKDIADQIHQGLNHLDDGPVTRALLASGKWKRVREEAFLGFVGAEVDVFQRLPQP